MSSITITQVGSPSRSKMAGACWFRIGGIYASTTARTIEAAKGSKICVEGKVTLRRVTRVSVDHGSWDLLVTGNPEDTVTLSLGIPQSLDAVVTGVREA